MKARSRRDPAPAVVYRCTVIAWPQAYTCNQRPMKTSLCMSGVSQQHCAECKDNLSRRLQLFTVCAVDFTALYNHAYCYPRQPLSFLTAAGSAQQRLLSYVTMLILVLCYAPQMLCVLPRPNHVSKPGQHTKHASTFAQEPGHTEN